MTEDRADHLAALRLVAELRDEVRRAVDARRRKLVEPHYADAKRAGRCVGCGGDYSANTEGCRSCRDRNRNRRRYGYGVGRAAA